MFIHPEEVAPVMNTLSAEGWDLKPRHVIVNTTFEKHVVSAVESLKSNDQVRTKKRMELSLDTSILTEHEDEVPTEDSNVFTCLLKRTFLHIPTPSSLWSGPSSGPKTASTTDRNGKNPRQSRKGPRR